MSRRIDDGISRRSLLAAGAAVGTAGVVAAGLGAATGLTPAARAATPELTEPERLARLIEVEQLLEFSYRHVLASGILHPPTAARVSPFVAHEQAHIAALGRRLAALGGTPPPGPADVRAANRDLAHRKVGGRLGQLRGDLDAVRLLLSLEQVTIGAYFVALLSVTDPALIGLITQIMANEAQHDALLGLSLPPYKPGSAAPYGLVQGLQ